MHEALERLFEVPAAERIPATAVSFVRPAWERLAGTSDMYDHLVEQIDAIISEAERMVESYFRVEDPQRIEPVGCEQWVRGDVGGVPMHGIIDRLDEVAVSDGTTLVITDYKSSVKVPDPSSRFLDERFFAMKTYARMLMASGRRVGFLRLVFPAGGTPESALLFEMTPAAAADIDRIVSEAAVQMREAAASGTFPCRPSKLCDWCDFKDRCPVFAHEDSE